MIELRAIQESDLGLFLAWRNDRKLRQYFREYRELTVADQINWFQNLAGDSTRAMFTVEEIKSYEKDGKESEGRRPIGCAGITNIDWFHRSGEVSCYVESTYIDERAEEAIEKLISVGFTDYGLHRLYAEVWAFDDLKGKALKKAGFRHEGTLAKSHWYNGAFHDSLLFGLLNKSANG